MNRLEFAYPEVFALLGGVPPSARSELLLAIVDEIDRSGAVSGVEWDEIRAVVRAGGSSDVSVSIAAEAERADDVAFDYADAGDARYDDAFGTARLLSAVADACAPITVESCSDALYEFISSDGDQGRAVAVLTVLRS